MIPLPIVRRLGSVSVVTAYVWHDPLEKSDIDRTPAAEQAMQ